MTPHDLRSQWRRYSHVLMNRKRRLLGRLRRKPVAHLIHVGKTGGTALKQTLLPYVDAGTYTVFLHGHAMTLALLEPGEKTFFFQRDPISKFASAFYYRKREGRPHYHIPWRPYEAAAFADFQTANHLANSLSAEDPSQRARAERAMRSIHHVRDSAFRWFGDEAYFLSRLDDVLFIGFQDRLQHDFEILRGILGVPIEARLPPEDASARQKTPENDKYLDSTAVENLRAWYSHDLAFYELCRRIRRERHFGAS
jgi:hypothetical protein